MSYEEDLWDGVPKVASRYDDSRKHMKQTLSLFVERAKAETSYASSISNLGNSFTAGSPWSEVCQGHKTLASKHQQQGEAVEKEMLAPTEKWLRDSDKKASKLKEQAAALKNKYDAWDKKIEGLSKEFQAAADKGELAWRKKEWADKNLFLDAKERKKIEKAYASDYPAWEKKDAEYKKAVEEGNAFLTTYVAGMKSALRGFQQIEEERGALSSRMLTTYASFNGVKAANIDEAAELKRWIQTNKTGKSPPGPWSYEPYAPKHEEIPYEAPDPGALPSAPRKGTVLRHQVAPKMVPIKTFMKAVYESIGGDNAPSSPRGAGPPKSPRRLGKQKEAPVPMGPPLASISSIASTYKATLGQSPGFEFLDAHADKKNLFVRHVDAAYDGCGQTPATSSVEHFSNVETQLLKIVYGQKVESSKAGKTTHDKDTPMLFHVIFVFPTDADLSKDTSKSEWKGAIKRGKPVDQGNGWALSRHQSTAYFQECDISWRLYRSIWAPSKKGSSQVTVVEYFVRPDISSNARKWLRQYHFSDELSEAAQSKKLENQPSVQTIRLKRGGKGVSTGDTVRAMFDFEPEEDDDVPRHTMVKGEKFEVLAPDDGSGWLMAKRLKDGKSAFVPSNFVTPL